MPGGDGARADAGDPACASGEAADSPVISLKPLKRGRKPRAIYPFKMSVTNLARVAYQVSTADCVEVLDLREGRG